MSRQLSQLGWHALVYLPLLTGVCSGQPISVSVDSLSDEAHIIGNSGLPIGSVFIVTVDRDMLGRLSSGIKLPVHRHQNLRDFRDDLRNQKFVAVESFNADSTKLESQVILIAPAFAAAESILPIRKQQYTLHQLASRQLQLTGRLGQPIGTVVEVSGQCVGVGKTQQFEVSSINNVPCKPIRFEVPPGLPSLSRAIWKGKVRERISTGDIGYVLNQIERLKTAPETPANRTTLSVNIPYQYAGMRRFDRLHSQLQIEPN